MSQVVKEEWRIDKEDRITNKNDYKTDTKTTRLSRETTGAATFYSLLYGREPAQCEMWVSPPFLLS